MFHFFQIIHDRNGDVTVQLTALQLFARDVYRLLCSSDGKLACNSFETAYIRRFGTAVQPSRYGHPNLISLLQAVNHIVIIRGKGAKRLLLLNKAVACEYVSFCSLFINYLIFFLFVDWFWDSLIIYFQNFLIAGSTVRRLTFVLIKLSYSFLIHIV